MTSIALDYNIISEVDLHAFNGLVSLKQLSMSRNSIAGLHPATFADVTQLQKMQLSHNNLKHVHPDLLMKNRQLQLFHVGNNRITILPSDLFKHNNKLAEVYVNDNELTLLNRQQFQHNPKLRIVHLENNNIMHLHVDTFSYSTVPLYVNLNNNELRQFRDNLVQKDCHTEIVDKASACQFLCFKGTVHIDISGNPLVCGTHLEDDLELYHNYDVRNEGDWRSGSARISTMSFRGRRLYRTIFDNRTISENSSSYPLPSSAESSNCSAISSDFSRAEDKTAIPQEKQKVSNNDTHVVSGNESAAIVSVNEYGMASASPPRRTEPNISTDVTLVEYDSPMVLRESTVRGILFIAIECLLASIIFLRKFMCPRNGNDSTVADRIELISESGPNSEENSQTESTDV